MALNITILKGDVRLKCENRTYCSFSRSKISRIAQSGPLQIGLQQQS